MSATRLVIFVVGPPKVGKTAIANHIAELSESLSSSEYHPTQGVRILEFDRKLVSDGKRHKWKELNVEVELWDCSGDPEFHAVWPAVSSHAHGVLFVTSPDIRQDKELDVWPDLFPTIKSNQCAVFVHRPINTPNKGKVKLTHRMLSKAPVLYTSLDQEPEMIRGELDALLQNAYAAMVETREREERQIAGVPMAAARSRRALGLLALGFDFLSVLGRVATRPAPLVDIGPVDLSASFLVTDARKPDCPIVYASPAFEALTGYAFGEVVGRNCRFLQAPSGYVARGSERKLADNTIIAEIAKAVATGNEAHFTLINYKKGGQPFMNHLTIIPISMDGSSAITHFVGLQADVICQPQAILGSPQGYPGLSDELSQLLHIESAAASQAPAPNGLARFMRSMIDELSDFVHVVSIRGVILSVSEEVSRRLLEFESSELLGHNISKIVHPSDLVSVMRELRTCPTGGTVNFLCRVLRKKSGYIFMEMNGHMYLRGKRNRCFIMTGRERRFASFSLDSSVISGSDCLETWLKLSPQGLILHAAADAEPIFRVSPDDLFSRALIEFVHPVDHARLAACMHNTMQAAQLDASQTEQVTSSIGDSPAPGSSASANHASCPGQHITIATKLWSASHEIPVTLRLFAFGNSDARFLYCQVQSKLSSDSPSPPHNSSMFSLAHMDTAPDSASNTSNDHGSDGSGAGAAVSAVATATAAAAAAAAAGASFSPSAPHADSKLPDYGAHMLDLVFDSPKVAKAQHTDPSLKPSDMNVVQTVQALLLSLPQPQPIDPTTATENLLKSMDESRPTTVNYELNRLRFLNKRLADEIDQLKRRGGAYRRLKRGYPSSGGSSSKGSGSGGSSSGGGGQGPHARGHVHHGRHTEEHSHSQHHHHHHHHHHHQQPLQHEPQDQMMALHPHFQTASVAYPFAMDVLKTKSPVNSAPTTHVAPSQQLAAQMHQSHTQSLLQQSLLHSHHRALQQQAQVGLCHSLAVGLVTTSLPPSTVLALGTPLSPLLEQAYSMAKTSLAPPRPS
ncbi:hypothetical protein HK105_208918 [Polyrhizophydium stewartii]|uniref:PAS domain-containing protein n=1 Tax=Polyrhizophydium stewartii TaxID=2732419 RepID=A0ABR4MWH2_9FUNG